MARGKKKCDYSRLDNTEKDLRREPGLFLFPEAIEGKTDHGLRKFLVFYFDEEADYKTVLEDLKKPTTKTRSHPDMDSKKLVRILGEYAHMERNLRGE